MRAHIASENVDKDPSAGIIAFDAAAHSRLIYALRYAHGAWARSGEHGLGGCGCGCGHAGASWNLEEDVVDEYSVLFGSGLGGGQCDPSLAFACAGANGEGGTGTAVRGRLRKNDPAWVRAIITRAGAALLSRGELGPGGGTERSAANSNADGEWGSVQRGD